jgi:hypothetical protein
VGASGLEPLDPKERIYSPPQLPLCDTPFCLLFNMFSSKKVTNFLVHALLP